MDVLEKIMPYANYLPPKDEKNAFRLKNGFRDLVGLLPASEGTPDIYYCADKLSQQVAIRSFLTMWFLDEPIRQMVKQRAESVICGLSPLSGGKRLEEVFKDRAKLHPITERREVSVFGNRDTRYAGRCYSPEFDAQESLVKKGFMAVYATCVDVDAENRYTWEAQLFANEGRQKYPLLPELDPHYILQNDNPRKEYDGFNLLTEAFNRGDAEREKWLTILLRDGDDGFDIVPHITAHEIGHLLMRGTNLYPTFDIAADVYKNIKSHDRKFGYFSDPFEAVAELTGIALLKRVQQKIDIHYGLCRSHLNEVLPQAYAYIEDEIEALCCSSQKTTTPSFE